MNNCNLQCKCGCGGVVKPNSKGRIPNFILGHNARLKERREYSSQLLIGNANYKKRASYRGIKKCGSCQNNKSCNITTGVYKRACKDYKSMLVPQQCACGCGGVTEINSVKTKYNKYILGHNAKEQEHRNIWKEKLTNNKIHKGYKHSEETKQKLRISSTGSFKERGICYTPQGIINKKNSQRKPGFTVSDETKCIIGEASKRAHKKRCENPEILKTWCENISNANKSRFKKMTQEERISWQLARKVKRGCSSTINGTTVYHDSGWERSMFQILSNLNVDFVYDGLTPTPIELTTGYYWYPDFVFPSLSIILDVKGFYKAREKFVGKIFPALPEYIKEKFSVVLFDKDPSKHSYNSIEQIFMDATWWHISNKHKNHSMVIKCHKIV